MNRLPNLLLSAALLGLAGCAAPKAAEGASPEVQARPEVRYYLIADT